MKKRYHIALAGNPNVGKSTLFNALTGAHQHTGNWPGKTIDKKEGYYSFKGTKIDITDLPGTYSLSPYSQEEIVAKDYILEKNPDIIVHILDSSNIERNLYLTIQLLELKKPLIIVLNMLDDADKKGIDIDSHRLSYFLKCPVVRMNAKKKQGINELKEAILEKTRHKKQEFPRLTYGKELNKTLRFLQQESKQFSIPQKYCHPFLAIKLLEKDDETMEEISKIKNGKRFIETVSKKRIELEKIYSEDIDSTLAQARYGFIAGLIKDGVVTKKRAKRSLTDKIDAIVLNKYFGIPLFLLIMFLMFEATFTLADPLVGMIESLFASLGLTVNKLLTTLSAPTWLQSLFADGIITGVGSVLVFVPNIFLLFAFISILEDSGYMARAAFTADKFMHRIGLHGKSFIPFIVGFGCNVPAIMATRTLDSKRDRLLTMLITPFMSCSARLPIYVLFVGAFFPNNQGLIIFSLYMLGIVIAIIMGMIFKKTLFKGLSSSFVMELPPYRIPTLFGTLLHMWRKGKAFIVKAGSIIFFMVLLIWFLASFPWGVEYASQDSFIGIIGSFIAPIFKPLGFGDWQSSIALIFGFMAKEVIVGTLATLHGVSEEGLTVILQNHFTPLSAYSFMVFTLLYVPCMAVLATIKRETGTWKWPIFTAIYTTILAWVVAFFVYQIGLLLTVY